MKKTAAFLTALCITAGAAVTAFADTPVVKVNDTPIAFAQGEEPFIENDRTLIPMRAVFEAVGAQMGWDEETGTVVATREKDGKLILVSLQIGADKAFTSTEGDTVSQEVVLDVPAKIVNDRTFVPLRFVIESLGETVLWDQESYTATIVTQTP